MRTLATVCLLSAAIQVALWGVEAVVVGPHAPPFSLSANAGRPPG